MASRVWCCREDFVKKNIDGNEFEVDNRGFETWKNMTRKVPVCLVLLVVYLSFWQYFFLSNNAS